jgi:hypothetical protein
MRMAGARTAESIETPAREGQNGPRGGAGGSGRDRLRSVPPRLAAALCLAPALGVTLLVVWLVRPAANFLHPNTGHDFMLIYAAANALRHAQNPYDPATLLHYTLMAGMPLHFLVSSGQFDQPYVYPPVFAWLALPLTHLGPSRALLVWRVLSAGAVLAGTYGLTAPWRQTAAVFATRWRRLVLALVVTAAPLTLYGLYWGNPVLLVYAAMGGWVWALSRQQQRWDVAAGVLMSVALLKFQLALPLAALAAFCLIRGEDAWARRRRVAYGFVGACACWLALDLLVTSPALLLAWPRSILDLSHITQQFPDMPSLLGLLQPWAMGLSQGAYTALTLAVGGAALAALVALFWRLRGSVPPAPLFALLATVWCFGTPYGHANDEILLLPGGFALLAALLTAQRRWMLPSSARAAQLMARGAPGLACLALVLLYLGGTPHFMVIVGYRPPWYVVTLAPLALLLALGPAVGALARSSKTVAAAATGAGARPLAAQRARSV